MNEQEQQAIEVLVNHFREKLIASHTEITSYSMVVNSSEEKFNKYVNVIADYFCIESKDITGKRSRLSDIKKSRHILWWLCRTGDSNLKWSLSKIGQKTCEERPFDHATVLHGVKTLANDIDYCNTSKQDLKAIVECLGMSLVKVGSNWSTEVK